MAMEQLIKKKVLSFDCLINLVENLKSQGKVVVQSHGVFDIIHPGIIIISIWQRNRGMCW